MTKPRTIPAVLAVLALALALAGCGNSEPKGAQVPRTQAGELDKQLSSIQDRVNFGDGACNDITNDNEPSVSRVLDELPRRVDRDVRDALRKSFDRLFELTASQCDSSKGQDTTPTETQTTPKETQTETQRTQTQRTETQRTETQPTQTQEGPPGQNKQKKGKKQKPNGNGGGPAAPPGGG